MANPFYGEAEAEIGGQRYKLVFNFSAIAAIENHPYGCSFQAIARELSPNDDGSPKSDMKMSLAALLLWGCLRTKHSTVSYDDAGNMLLGEDGETAVQALLECVSKAFPTNEGGGEGNPRKRRGTSKAI